MRVLVTGAAGYIGSHIVVELLEAGHSVVALDDFSSGHPEALRRTQQLAGRSCTVRAGKVGDIACLDGILTEIDAVIHLAAFKKVGESVSSPELYFDNNTGEMSRLLRAMHEAGVERIIYSSTAAVYGEQAQMPLSERHPPLPQSPYGLSKLQGERMLHWMARAHGWRATSLRYFNPVGAHPSGRIGEPVQQASSLVPRALKAVSGTGPPLSIFGTDYDTPDGTGMRDYIHVCDLARAHLLALEAPTSPGHRVFNVGTGRPHSVREVLAACERVCGRKVPATEGPRRAGDVAIAVADPSRFRQERGFQALNTLDDMVESAWRWMQRNPEGYGDARAPLLAADRHARRPWLDRSSTQPVKPSV